MATRPQFSTAGRPRETGTRAQGARGARSAASGLPTVYQNCQELTKDGRPCRAPVRTGHRTCVGHGRKEGTVAE